MELVFLTRLSLFKALSDAESATIKGGFNRGFARSGFQEKEWKEEKSQETSQEL